jgi:diguanylate cyclase (GGDEF)-like protein
MNALVLLVCSPARQPLLRPVVEAFCTQVTEVTLEPKLLTSAEAAFKAAFNGCALLIVDADLPELAGSQLSQLLKADAQLQHIPLVLLQPEEQAHSLWLANAKPDALVCERNWTHEGEAVLLGLKPLILQGLASRPAPTLQRASQGASQSNGVSSLTPLLMQRLSETLVQSHIHQSFQRYEALTGNLQQWMPFVFSTVEGLVEYDVMGLCVFGSSLYEATLTLQSANEQVFPQALYDDLVRRHHELLEQLRTQNSPNGKPPEGYPKVQILSEVHSDPEDPFAPYKGLETEPSVQLISQNGQALGSLLLYAQQPKPYDQLFPLGLVRQSLATSLQLHRLYAQQQALAVRDGLTSLWNHQQCMEHLQREFQRAERYELTLSVAVIDIVELAVFNEQWGSRSGNDLLRLVASLIQQAFRESDIVARFSGSTFMVLMPETEQAEAEVACERLKQSAAKSPLLSQGQRLAYQLCMGVASLDLEAHAQATDLLLTARQAPAAGKTSLERGSNSTCRTYSH